MELIVDGKNVLEPVNLEQNKREIMRQRDSVPSQVSLTNFKENVGWFRANVKGDDLNGLVTELQNTFSDINVRETKMYDQLDSVFKTVEAIHKGSIEGVIVGVKSAQEAISQVEYAIEQISETLLIIQGFKEQLEDNTEHLNDIDVIWDATQQLKKDILGLENALTQKFKKLEYNVNSLIGIKNVLDKIKHLKDIDKMHKDLSSICRDFEQEKSKTSNQIVAMAQEIQQLDSFKVTINKLVHLKEIDTMYTELTELQNMVEVETDKYDKEISTTNESVKELIDFKLSIENQKHLKEIDTIWETVQGNSCKLKSIDSDMSKIEVLENEVIELKGKIKFLHYVLGGTVGVLVLQIILNMIGIL